MQCSRRLHHKEVILDLLPKNPQLIVKVRGRQDALARGRSSSGWRSGCCECPNCVAKSFSRSDLTARLTPRSPSVPGSVSNRSSDISRGAWLRCWTRSRGVLQRRGARVSCGGSPRGGGDEHRGLAGLAGETVRTAIMPLR